MIRINYQTFGTKGFNLRLRLYNNVTKETKFITVNKLIKGSVQKKHWNAKRQVLYPGAPFSEENNDTLVKFKKKYEDKALNWVGSLDSFLLEMKNGSIDPDSHKLDRKSVV